jgi:hypothetical protein
MVQQLGARILLEIKGIYAALVGAALSKVGKWIGYSRYFIWCLTYGMVRLKCPNETESDTE